MARLISEMDKARVNRALLFPENLQIPIQHLAEVQKLHSGRFAIVGAVDPLSPDAVEVAEETRLRWAVAGISLSPSEAGRRWLNAFEVMPLWERLEQLGVAVSLHIASQDYNQFSDVVTTFPALRIVLEDLGSGPETMLSQYVPILLEYARYPQVHVSLSGLFRVSSLPYPYPDLWPVVESVYRTFGGRRLVWGSGYPEVLAASGYENAVELLARFPFLDTADRELIGHGNAARLWFD
ncbi:MAG: amidohydrolase [Acidobacteria bacterium]|nr:MAG: amidohydrolase [Acidobacteriota bacterium]